MPYWGVSQLAPLGGLEDWAGESLRDEISRSAYDTLAYTLGPFYLRGLKFIGQLFCCPLGS
jgi:hypothetical protein